MDGSQVQVVGDPRPVALIACRIFEALGIPYLLGGSMASTFHGEPRATLDADFAVHLRPEDVGMLFRALADQFYVDELSVLEAATSKRMFNVIHSKAFIKVDVHVREATGHSAEEMSRAARVELLEGEVVRVATPEDTVLRKLWWYRMGDEASDRQWRDVIGVLQLSELKLDEEYMRLWSDSLGVRDLFDSALREVEPS